MERGERGHASFCRTYDKMNAKEKQAAAKPLRNGTEIFMTDRNSKEIHMERASEEHEIKEMISMIDGMMEGGVSRLKVKVTEELDPGERRRQYHHGRCDIGSPWACGMPFDVLE